MKYYIKRVIIVTSFIACLVSFKVGLVYGNCDDIIAQADDILGDFYNAAFDVKDQELFRSKSEIEVILSELYRAKGGGIERKRKGDSDQIISDRRQFFALRRYEVRKFRAQFVERIQEWLRLQNVEFIWEGDWIVFSEKGDSPINRYSRMLRDRFGGVAVFAPWLVGEAKGFVSKDKSGKIRQGLSVEFLLTLKASSTERHELIHVLLAEKLAQSKSGFLSASLMTREPQGLIVRSGAYETYVSAEEILAHFPNLEASLKAGAARRLHARLLANRASRIALRFQLTAQEALQNLSEVLKSSQLSFVRIMDSKIFSVEFKVGSQVFNLFVPNSLQGLEIIRAFENVESKRFEAIKLELSNLENSNQEAREVLNKIRECGGGYQACREQGLVLTTFEDGLVYISAEDASGIFQISLSESRSASLRSNFESISQERNQFERLIALQIQKDLNRLYEVSKIAYFAYDGIGRSLRAKDESGALEKMHELRRAMAAQLN